MVKDVLKEMVKNIKQMNEKIKEEGKELTASEVIEEVEEEG